MRLSGLKEYLSERLGESISIILFIAVGYLTAMEISHLNFYSYQGFKTVVLDIMPIAAFALWPLVFYFGFRERRLKKSRIAKKALREYHSAFKDKTVAGGSLAMPREIQYGYSKLYLAAGVLVCMFAMLFSLDSLAFNLVFPAPRDPVDKIWSAISLAFTATALIWALSRFQSSSKPLAITPGGLILRSEGWLAKTAFIPWGAIRHVRHRELIDSRENPVDALWLTLDPHFPAPRMVDWFRYRLEEVEPNEVIFPLQYLGKNGRIIVREVREYWERSSGKAISKM